MKSGPDAEISKTPQSPNISEILKGLGALPRNGGEWQQSLAALEALVVEWYAFSRCFAGGSHLCKGWAARLEVNYSRAYTSKPTENLQDPIL